MTVAGKDIYDLVDQIPDPTAGTPTPNETIAANVWSYRLYFNKETGDDLVRRGDIVKKDDIFYLVLSADCDLGHFWKKNLGIINTVVLHPLENKNSDLKKILTICVKSQQLPGKPSSLLGQIGELATGPFVLPFVPLDGEKKHFIAIPKDIVSQRIDLPAKYTALAEKDKSKIAVKYSHWLPAKRICTISEPFLTPVIQHVLNVVGGHGVPDYPEQMKTILKGILEEFSTTTQTTASSTQPTRTQ
ncbi:MAG: hypothetical protein BWY26_01508 [Elusimicrobia bacterium ADurb.Bin231]|nr:MAG: hypothetical protein BWY26_01508 [Elusimicrobia bacterium ADurb.Bin231]